MKYNDAIDLIFKEMTSLRSELVSQDNLERLKWILKYKIIKSLETNAGILNNIELKNDFRITSDYLFYKINEITPEKIRDVAIKYLPKSRAEGDYVLSLRDPLKK